MGTIGSLINERIASLKVGIEQNKDRGRWANCSSLSGGISELWGLASDIESQPLNAADGKARPLCADCRKSCKALLQERKAEPAVAN